MVVNANTDIVLVRCVARVPAPCMLEHLSKVRFAVKEPRTCLPWFSRKRVIATFRFPGDGAWERRDADGMFEQYTDYEAVNLGTLRRLQEDLMVKVKVWAQRRVDSARVTKRLGDFLDYMPALPRLTLQMTVTYAGAKFGWLVPLSALGRYAIHGHAPVNGETADEGSVHSEAVSDSSVEGGSIHSPPGHDELSAGSWQAPGAWTSKNDELDEEDLRLLRMLGDTHPYKPPAAPRDCLQVPPLTHSVPTATAVPPSRTRRRVLSVSSRPSLPRRLPPWRRKPHSRRHRHTAPTTVTTTKGPSSETLLTFLFLVGVLWLLECWRGPTYFEA